MVMAWGAGAKPPVASQAPSPELTRFFVACAPKKKVQDKMTKSGGSRLRNRGTIVPRSVKMLLGPLFQKSSGDVCLSSWGVVVCLSVCLSLSACLHACLPACLSVWPTLPWDLLHVRSAHMPGGIQPHGRGEGSPGQGRTLLRAVSGKASSQAMSNWTWQGAETRWQMAVAISSLLEWCARRRGHWKLGRGTW